MAIKSRMVRYATDLGDLRDALDEAAGIVHRANVGAIAVDLSTATGSTLRVELQMRDTVPPTFVLVLS